MVDTFTSKVSFKQSTKIQLNFAKTLQSLKEKKIPSKNPLQASSQRDIRAYLSTKQGNNHE